MQQQNGKKLKNIRQVNKKEKQLNGKKLKNIKQTNQKQSLVSGGFRYLVLSHDNLMNRRSYNGGILSLVNKADNFANRALPMPQCPLGLHKPFVQG